jgi:hypothetical protein
MLVVAIAAMLLSAPARPHVHGWSDEDNQWLAQQGSAMGVCCSGSEALVLQDPYWRSDDLDKCKVAPSQSNMGPTIPGSPANPIKFCVLFGSTWWAIPENAVVKAKNRKGFALVWPIFADKDNPKYLDEHGDPQLNYIRCFLEGTGA